MTDLKQHEIEKPKAASKAAGKPKAKAERPGGRTKPAGSGRKKGTPNRITGVVKEAVLEAFETVGGAEYLVRLADEEPRVFATLLAKCIPQEVVGAGGKDLIPENAARPVLVVPAASATPEAWADAVKALDNPGVGAKDGGAK